MTTEELHDIFEMLIRKGFDSAAEQLHGHYKAQSEAMVEAVGLLREIQTCDASITDSQAELIDSSIDTFLARYAQAEQQEVCEQCGGTGEADSGGVMPWGEPAMIKCQCQYDAQAFINLGSVQWAGWQARAALATQPAAGEPVAWQFEEHIYASGIGHVWTEKLEASMPNAERRVRGLTALYTSPPAAAHGDEAVAIVSRYFIDPWYDQSGQGGGWRHEVKLLTDLPDGTKLYAMRAQAGEGGE